MTGCACLKINTFTGLIRYIICIKNCVCLQTKWAYTEEDLTEMILYDSSKHWACLFTITHVVALMLVTCMQGGRWLPVCMWEVDRLLLACVCEWVFACIWEYGWVFTYVYVRWWFGLCMYVSVYVRTCVYVCVRARMCVCVRARSYVCMHICMCVSDW